MQTQAKQMTCPSCQGPIAMTTPLTESDNPETAQCPIAKNLRRKKGEAVE